MARQDCNPPEFCWPVVCLARIIHEVADLPCESFDNKCFHPSYPTPIQGWGRLPIRQKRNWISWPCLVFVSYLVRQPPTVAEFLGDFCRRACMSFSTSPKVRGARQVHGSRR
jgi:hypothetical protein